MKKLPIYLLISITLLSLAACNQATKTEENSEMAHSESIKIKEESISNREAEIKTSESIKAKEESIAKKEAELEKKVASAVPSEKSVSSTQETPHSKTTNSQGEPQNQEPIAQQINSSLLDDYNVQEIEYARILLMTNTMRNPDTPVVNVSHSPAGSPVSSYSTGSVTYPYDVTHLYGDYGASGSITYASHGDGTITIYDVPSHWHQADQSPEGYYTYTKKIVDSAQTVYVDPGYDIDVINKIESIDFIYK